MLKSGKIVPLFLVAFLLALFTTACNPEEVMPEEAPTTTNSTDPNRFMESVNSRSSNSDTAEVFCFSINYPVTVLFPDGSSQAVNSDEELETVADIWYDNHPDAEEDPTLIFPITITLEDGSTQTIDDEDTLFDLFDECCDDDEWDDDDWGENEDCFTIDFPFEVSTSAGTSLINDQDDFDDFLDGLGEEEDFDFIYPLQVTFEDGSSETLNDEDELEDLLDDCYDDWEEEEDWDELDDFDCFLLNFPVTINTDAGSMVFNDEEALFDYLDELIDDETDFEFAFPLEVTLTEDSTQLVINDEEEFDDLLSDCFEDWDEDEECFDFVYPIQLTTDAGTTTINSDDDFEAFCDSLGEDEDFQFVFPIDIILPDGSQPTINDEEALYAAGEACID
ncbi:MAG: hypothetical protein AAF433_09465 [Bacteroidota bacterium]